MKRQGKRVLVLNANYLPIATQCWKEAIAHVIENEYDANTGFEIIECFNGIIRTCGRKWYPFPAVVRNVQYVDLSKRKISFNKGNVFLRDKMTCCYCGLQDFSCENLTFDHVVPRSRYRELGGKGTPTKWENIVTACRKCNLRKENKTLNEAGLQLLKHPVQPPSAQYILGLSPWSRIPKEWEIYITPMYKHLIKK
jgi:hypothetical protein